MIIGEYRHTIDAKKRLAIPANFRKELGKKVVLTRGLDNCLFVYPVKSWEKVVTMLGHLPMVQADSRGFNRFMLAGAIQAEIDSLGRILVPDFLRDFAGLQSKVVIAGVNDRAEIWDETKWNEYISRVEQQADQLAEKLNDVQRA